MDRICRNEGEVDHFIVLLLSGREIRDLILIESFFFSVVSNFARNGLFFVYS